MSEREISAVVTGASSGIGLAICKQLAMYGYSLLMVSNDEENLVTEAKLISEKYNVIASVLYMDLAQKDSGKKLFDYCFVDNKFKIEILVNNAGIFYFKDVVDTSPELMETIINLHVYTPAMLCRLFSKQMIECNIKGYILNMASVSSRMMMPGIAMYSGTKSFLRGFSRAMRHEILEKGISITTISPGAVATNLYKLPPRYLKLGVKLGVIISADKLAKSAIKKVFKQKAEYIPAAFINSIFIFIVKILPEPLIGYIRKIILKRMLQ